MKSVGVAVALLLLTASAEARRILKPLPPPPTRDVGAELDAAIRKKDATALGALLGDPVVNYGVWFTDAACAKRFSAPEQLTGADRLTFVRCLVRLKPQATTRKSSGTGHGVFTYEPGIEIEISERGGRVQWLGFLAQNEGEAGRPTLTLQAFEALRKGGSPNVDAAVRGQLDPLLDDSRRVAVSQWMKICIDARGVVDRVATVDDDPQPADVASAFEAAARAWSFRPFAPDDKPTPACALSYLTYPAARAPLVERLPSPMPRLMQPESVSKAQTSLERERVRARVQAIEQARRAGVLGPPPVPPPPPPPGRRNISPVELDKYRTGGNKNIQPDEATKRAIAAAGKDRVTASFKLCLDDAGALTEITPLKGSGFPDYDAKLRAGMGAWTYRPYLASGQPIAVCTAYTFIYPYSTAGGTP